MASAWIEEKRESADLFLRSSITSDRRVVDPTSLIFRSPGAGRSNLAVVVMIGRSSVVSNEHAEERLLLRAGTDPIADRDSSTRVGAGLGRKRSRSTNGDCSGRRARPP